MKPSKYVAIFTLAVVLVNFLLFIFRRLDFWIFLIVLAFSAIIAFLIVPGLRKRDI